MPQIKHLSLGLFFDDQKNIFFTKFEDKENVLSVPASKFKEGQCPVSTLRDALFQKKIFNRNFTLIPKHAEYAFTDYETNDHFILNIFFQEVSNHDVNPEIYSKFISPKALIKHWRSKKNEYTTAEGFVVSKLTLSALSDIWKQFKKNSIIEKAA